MRIESTAEKSNSAKIMQGLLRMCRYHVGTRHTVVGLGEFWGFAQARANDTVTFVFALYQILL